MNQRTPLVARVRGACVGSVSAAVSIAAHGAAGGGAPDQQSLVFLLAVCAAVGAAVPAVRLRHDPAVRLGLLAGGQVLGHLTLGVSAGHGHGIVPGPTMLASHLAALVASAVLVAGAERACRRILGALRRIVVVLLSLPPVQAPIWVAVLAPRTEPARRLLVSAQAGRRGPPGVLV